MTTATQTKTVLITGASSGIGLGIAEAYVKRGDNVVLNGRDEKKLAEAAARLGHPDRVALVAGDIGDRDTGRRLVETALGGRDDALADVVEDLAGRYDAVRVGVTVPLEPVQKEVREHSVAPPPCVLEGELVRIGSRHHEPPGRREKLSEAAGDGIALCTTYDVAVRRPGGVTGVGDNDNALGRNLSP